MVSEESVALTINQIPLQDSIANDSVILSHEPVFGIILTPPEAEVPSPERNSSGTGLSFILSGLFILFLIVALRFRNNMKYLGAMFRDLVDIRTRHNVFDDTVRETSLILILNILWCMTAGIIGFYSMRFFYSHIHFWEMATSGILICMAIAVAYTLFMCVAYYSVGWIFSDKLEAGLWLKGFLASQALMTPLLFLTALASLSLPDDGLEVIIAGCVAFILARLAFIWKGYRIFFNQISSWVLFLCYLCSLELVPLVLTYRLALFFGEN